MAKALGAIVILLLVGSLLWIAGELHYRNCIDAARAEIDGLPKLERELKQEFAGTLSKRVRGCSRLPL